METNEMIEVTCDRDYFLKIVRAKGQGEDNPPITLSEEFYAPLRMPGMAFTIKNPKGDSILAGVLNTEDIFDFNPPQFRVWFEVIGTPKLERPHADDPIPDIIVSPQELRDLEAWAGYERVRPAAFRLQNIDTRSLPLKPGDVLNVTDTEDTGSVWVILEDLRHDGWTDRPGRATLYVSRYDSVPTTKQLPPMPQPDMVNHPPHYTTGRIEVADYIADQGLDFFAGNVVKYVSRHKHKGHPLEDLRKARWYLDYAIKQMEETT